MNNAADEQERELLEALTAWQAQQDKHNLIDSGVLRPAMHRQGLRQYLHEVWRYRDFIFRYASGRAVLDTDEMYLGKIWNILDPLLRISMYAVIFGLLLRTSRGIENFLGFLIIGVMFFSMLSKGLGAGSGLLERSKALIRTFTFPKASLVFTEGLRNALSSVIPGLVAIVAALYFQGFSGITPAIASVVPLFILIHVFATGLMFIVARITTFVPDTKKVVFYVNRAWFYISGIFYSVERYVSVPRMEAIMTANPGYRFLSAVRNVTLYSQPLQVSEWIALVAWSGGVFIGGFIFFWLAEDRYAQVK